MISAFLLLVVMFLFRIFAMSNSSITCANVESEYKIRGGKTFVLVYKKEGVVKRGKVSSDAFKIKEFKELKKFDCIQIKYSNSFPSYIEIIDKRLRSGSGY